MILEGGLFKVEQDLNEVLQRRSEVIEWQEKIRETHRLLKNDESEEASLTLSKLLEVLEEGRDKRYYEEIHLMEVDILKAISD